MITDRDLKYLRSAQSTRAKILLWILVLAIIILAIHTAISFHRVYQLSDLYGFKFDQLLGRNLNLAKSYPGTLVYAQTRFFGGAVDLVAMLCLGFIVSTMLNMRRAAKTVLSNLVKNDAEQF